MRPRIRTLKPEIWADEKIGALPHGARLLFLGLVTMADDEGRLRELPAAITGHVFPWDDVSFARLKGWLADLSGRGSITQYAAGDCRYIAITHWFRHQRVDKPRPSELPLPVVDGSETARAYLQERDETLSKIDRGNGQENSRSLRAGASGPVLSSSKTSTGKADVARELFAYWQEQCEHPQAKFTAERRRKVEARLKEGYDEGQIRKAIEGAAKAAFVNESGKRFDDIELICRNGSKLEDFMSRADTKAQAKNGSVEDSATFLARRGA